MDDKRLTIGGVETPYMKGDNLAVTLASYFEKHGEPIDEDTGWGPTATKSSEEIFDAIDEHYMDTPERNMLNGSTLAEVLDSVRERGWTIAAHNDYAQDGKNHTFYLWTHKATGRFVRGGATTDSEAVRKCVDAMNDLEERSQTRGRRKEDIS